LDSPQNGSLASEDVLIIDEEVVEDRRRPIDLQEEEDLSFLVF
jgi:hypothetical protein